MANGKENKTVYTILILIVIVGLIIYAIYLIDSYKKRKFIFAPYVQPPLKNGYQPQGKVTPLTPEEIECVKQQYGNKQGSKCDSLIKRSNNN